jgi:hypothetical protein
MSEKEKKDGVQDPANPANGGAGSGQGGAGGGDDKDNNLAALRKKLADAEKERDEAIRKLTEKGGGAEGDRSLDLPGDTTPPEKKPEAAAATEDDPIKKIFKRDLKEAAIQWNATNKVSVEIWNKIRSKVAFNGDETLSEIKAKLDDAYHSIPEVRVEREKSIREEGKKEAMKDHFDDDLDLPGGGSGEGGGSGAQGAGTRVPRETRAWGRGLGLTDKEISAVDPDRDPSEWDILDPAHK